MSDLANRQCGPIDGGTPPLKGDALKKMMSQVHGWDAVHGQRLSRTFKFANFADALAFTNRVGAIAEEQDHHPDIHLAWGKVVVETWTHSIGGLSENDFILAARIDALPQP